MKIHVWGINYSPEVTGIAPYNTVLCEFLHEQGHQPRMISAFCYYPAWQKLPTESRSIFRTDLMEEVPVHRCWLYVPRRVTPLRRIAHELSFVVTSFLRQLILPRPDVLVVISPPLLLGFAAWVLTRIKRAPFVFHVQDLQPDAAADLGMIREGVFLEMLRWLERFAYKRSSMVSGISKGILSTFSEKMVPISKQIFFPNGVDLPDYQKLPGRNSFRDRYKIPNDAFLAIYSGNMG